MGKQLAALAGQHMKPVVMELGGHGPVIVCADVDAERVALASVTMKTRNTGQICVSPTRWIVHDSIYDRFVATAAKRVAELRMGSGIDAGTEVGPLANPRRVEAIAALVEDARARGATIAAGGNRPASTASGSEGFFYPVTIITDMPADCRVLHEEPFGPLLLVQRFGDLGEAIAMANGLPFGLAAYAFTDSASNADRSVK